MVSGGWIEYGFAMDEAQDWKQIAKSLNDEGFALNLLRLVREQERDIWWVELSRDGKRWIIQADDANEAFVELERQTRQEMMVPR